MRDEAREQWMELCDQAAREQDPSRFVKLVAEIIRLLREKRTRLDASKGKEAA